MTNSQSPAEPHDCRLIVDSPASGEWNMAVDEVLLDWVRRARDQGAQVLRLVEPTLSLGYFQSYQERLGHGPSRDTAVVRRSSGGGAILHDCELTYSLAMPGEHALADDSSWLYTAVHQALIETLATWGIEATLCRPAEQSDVGTRPFLCFERRATGDVLLGAAKICGSASAGGAGLSCSTAAWFLAAPVRLRKSWGCGSLRELVRIRPK